VLRVSPDGGVEREQLAPDWIASAEVAEEADAVAVAWRESSGLKLRWLDRLGRPLGAALDAGGDRARPVRREGLHTSAAGLVLAIGEPLRWSFSRLKEGATVAEFQPLPGAEHYFLDAAPLDDGLAWASFSTDVDYTEMGKGGPRVHSWSARIDIGFVPVGGQASHQQVARTGGPGRGGLPVVLLARPGAAAALVVARDDARRLEDKSRLVPIRAACSVSKANPR
jgi:hypothetical protein